MTSGRKCFVIAEVGVRTGTCSKYDQRPAFVIAVMNPVCVVACFLDGGRPQANLTCNDFNEEPFRAAVRFTSVVNFVLL